METICPALDFPNGNTHVSVEEIKEGMDLEWIREQLSDRQMTQAELASRINLSPVQMSKILNGSRQLKADEAERIRKELGGKAHDHLDDDPEKIRIYNRVDSMNDQQIAALAQFLELLVGPKDDQSR